MDTFDSENNLPDELMSSPKADSNDIHSNDTAASATESGPNSGGSLIDAQDNSSNTGLHGHVYHSIMSHQVSDFFA